VDEQEWLASRFEGHRAHLRAVAYRMLGSTGEAEDAIQEAWLRVSRSNAREVDNLGGWLTTIVARVCLDLLRSRRSRREEPLGELAHEPQAGDEDDAGPEHEAVIGDSVGLALLVVLDTLTPTERVAFVLHDLFAVPFEEIAPIVRRSPDAARQLASRARRRVQGADPASTSGRDLERRRAIVDAFLAASRGGDLDALIALLDPDVVLRADEEAVRIGAPARVRGAAPVAETFSGRARAARPALVDGAPAAVWAQAGRPRLVFAFTIGGDAIVDIEMIADPARLESLAVTLVEA
jgi:RNA polymerase sigma factor (sigma-70 family)